MQDSKTARVDTEDPRTGEKVTMDKNGICSLCREGSRRGLPTEDVDERLKKALNDDETRQDVLGCVRILLNPRLAFFVLESLDEIQSRMKDVKINYAMMTDPDLIYWLKLEDGFVDELFAHADYDGVPVSDTLGAKALVAYLDHLAPW